jgi:D-lyxose ketol-isomerase
MATLKLGVGKSSTLQPPYYHACCNQSAFVIKEVCGVNVDA